VVKIKKMFSRRTVLIFFAAAAVMMSAAAIAKPDKPSGAPKAPSGAAQGCKYIVSEYNGYVAVFTPEGGEPAYVTATPLSALPSADRLSIETGIAVYSEKQLTAVLEDYES